MDPFYAFLTFAALLALEIIAGQSWLAGYYRVGIPVYVARWERKNDAAKGTTEDPAGVLEARFKGKPGFPALRFKRVAQDGQGRALIAFREVLLAPRSGPRYFPVMHSLLRVDQARGAAQVTGWLDWYVVFLLAYLVLNTIADRGFLFVAVLVLFLFGVSYVAQSAVNRAVVEEAAALLAQTTESE